MNDRSPYRSEHGPRRLTEQKVQELRQEAKRDTSRMLNPLTQSEIESLQQEMQQDGEKVRAWLQEKERTKQS